MVVTLMIAEKPSLARSLAEILSHKQYKRRKSSCSACDVYEFEGQLPVSGKSVPCLLKMTSVCGHVMSLDFQPQYNNWECTDPVDLFHAETVKKEAHSGLRMRHFLRQEGRGVDYLVLWLDCDKEGENICFEVINEIQPVMKPPRHPNSQTILRAKFSSITAPSILHAFNNLTLPNYNEARSVDARQEVDLRIGCSFTRFQTNLFQSQYVGLNHSVISYGPCQTPTLGFCVQRHDEIQQFKSEKYWKMKAIVKLEGVTMTIDWSRERLFDLKVAQHYLSLLKRNKQARVESVTEKPRSKAPPLAMNTVELLRSASIRLHVGPKQAMDIAERLYTEGYISYPRTETTRYSPEFDFRSVLADLSSNPEFGAFAGPLLKSGFKVPSGGKDVGDHPPITPMKSARRDDLRTTDWHVYELITNHFLATLYPECKYRQTDVEFSIGNESFFWSGSKVISPGFTAIATWQAIAGLESKINLVHGQSWDVEELKLTDHMTTPPGYLTESELISLMEKHGIGTDASIPVHIENICTRNYVRVNGSRQLVPTKLGIVLVHGYQKIDPELVQPTMRSAVEEQLNLIAKGKVDFDQVLNHTLEGFRKKFIYFRDNISNMDELFEASFSTVAETGKPLSRCGKCHRYMTYIPSKPQRLYCRHCDNTYSLPQGGTIKLYKELKCPMDDFEIVLFSSSTKTYTICPHCYVK